MKHTILFLLLFIHGFTVAQKTYVLPELPSIITENANIVLVEEQIEADVTSDDKIKVKTREVWLVLNKSGEQRLNLTANYDENSRVKDIRAQFYNLAGERIAHLKKKDFSDQTQVGENLYSDSRKLTTRYTPGFYPYVVVFENETESGDTAFIFPWIPVKSYAQSVLKSTYTIRFGSGNKPRYKPVNLDGFNISIEEQPEKFVFTASEIRPLKYEAYSPSFLSVFPLVYLALDDFVLKGKHGNAESWRAFGKWIEEELLQDVGTIPEHTVQRMKFLVANETTNEGKARKIYQYLQDKVRYVSVQIGIGGWKPMPASEVDKLSYGDCKALTNYTKALLDALSIPSYYTILYADETFKDIQEDFVSFQGNHAILGVPDGDTITWLECTSQDMPFGYVSASLHDRKVLMVTPEGGEIVQTKTYEAEENLQESEVKIDISASGRMTAKLKRTSQGLQYGNRYGLIKLNDRNRVSYYKERWNYINKFSVSDIVFDNNREKIVFTETLTLETDTYATPVSDGFLFAPNVFNRSKVVPPQVGNREKPLYIAFGFVDKDRVTVTLPRELRPQGLPDPVAIDTEFGSYSMSVEQQDDNTLIYTRLLKMKKGTYPPEEYDNYRDFLRTVSRMDGTRILLQQTE